MERHLERVKRFESLLKPFDPSPPAVSPIAGSSEGAATGAEGAEAAPTQGPVSAEAWRKDELRRLCREGIPDEPAPLRPAAWHFLLNLSPTPSLLDQYRSFLSEVNSRISALSPPEPRQPLDKYDKLLREIERDVERTFGTLAWFGAEVVGQEEADGMDAVWDRLELLDEADRQEARDLAARIEVGEEGESGEKTDEAAAASTVTASAPSTARRRPRTRRDALLRPLFLYAFLNPGVSFVQGMSYLAAIFYYVFASSSSTNDDSRPFSPLEVEATTFFALGALLSQLRDLYLPTLDNLSSPPFSAPSPTATGLGATVARFNSLLLVIDPPVADALDRKKVDTSGLVMRWLTTMFATEFPLPDVLRVWDRILSLYPPEGEQPSGEALSPVLGHLVDVCLAVVQLERQTILSPFAKLPKILGVLQKLPIEGEGIDRLLQKAWEVRERRLGRAKRTSIASSVGSNRTSVVGALGKKAWWSSSPAKTDVPTAAADFELDERSSNAGSDASRPSRFGFGSLAFSSPRSSQADMADNVTVVEGKVLPPPPARIDQPPTIASLIEEELRSTEKQADEEDYPLEDEEDGADEGPAIHRRMASGWGGIKSSLSRFAASDTAAALQKRATNLQLAAAHSASTASTRFSTSDAAAALFKAQSNAAAKAQLLREQLAEQGPDRLAKIKEAAAGASGRLLASTGSERGGDWRPGSPRETPFTPPGHPGDISPLPSPRIDSVDMGRSPSAGPKPLLLSGSARRAQNSSEDSTGFARSPSASPTISRTGQLLSPDISILPLSRSPSRGAAHGRSASQFDTPPRTSASAFRPRSSSSSTAQASPGYPLQDEDSPIQSRRVQDGANGLRRGYGKSSPSAAASSLPKLDLRADQIAASLSPSSTTAISRLSLDNSPGPSEVPFAPPSEQPFLPPIADESLLTTEREDEGEFLTPSEGRSAETSPTRQRLPPRGSSLSSSQGPSAASSALPPPRISSLSSSVPPSASSPSHDVPASSTADDTVAASPTGSLSRSRIVRRPAAHRKRTSRSSVASASVDLNGPEARRLASEFLVRSGSSRSTRECGHRRAASDARMSVGDFDESGFLDAYGGEDGDEQPR
ncbi:hypothetical protein NBRC10512_007833 [Rhodotorula toruloides]|uniref:TBC domain protein, Rab GTPase activator n=1 Tax=Rhodotorula toruloides (strain NP11) TaxID=1130832 RepID=M7XHH6_RHOT1|nr:TBC domain protein, Rab GTPase activator [Rhodotorula toruloides NP11]EMS23339.1 TBC domain protein, Rab GTPase activator [Rhodotorula toruloides NP11]